MYHNCRRPQRSATGASRSAFGESFQPSLSRPFSSPSTSRVLFLSNQDSKQLMMPRTVCPPAAERRWRCPVSIANANATQCNATTCNTKWLGPKSYDTSIHKTNDNTITQSHNHTQHTIRRPHNCCNPLYILSCGFS